MKIDFVLCVFSLCIALLAAYCFFNGFGGGSYGILLAAGSGICLFVTLSGCIVQVNGKKRLKIAVRLVSALFFVFFTVSNLVFTYLYAGELAYLLVNGSLLIAYIAAICVTAKFMR